MIQNKWFILDIVKNVWLKYMKYGCFTERFFFGIGIVFCTVGILIVTKRNVLKFDTVFFRVVDLRHSFSRTI